MQCLIDVAKLYNELADRDSEERGKYLLVACMDLMAGRTEKYPFIVQQQIPLIEQPKKHKPANRVTYESIKGAYSPLFEEFWKLYPKKVGKGAAWLSWKRLSIPHDLLLSKCQEALSWQSISTDWTKERGLYIPHPITYLNQRRFEDENSAGNTKIEHYMDINGVMKERPAK